MKVIGWWQIYLYAIVALLSGFLKIAEPVYVGLKLTFKLAVCSPQWKLLGDLSCATRTCSFWAAPRLTRRVRLGMMKYGGFALSFVSDLSPLAYTPNDVQYALMLMWTMLVVRWLQSGLRYQERRFADNVHSFRGHADT